MFDISALRTETSQDVCSLSVFSQPAVVRRAVNFFLTHSGPLQQSVGQGETRSGKSLRLVMQKADWHSKVNLHRDLINAALSNNNQGMSADFMAFFSLLPGVS